MSAKIFSHFLPLPSLPGVPLRCPRGHLLRRAVLSGQSIHAARYTHRTASDPTTCFPSVDHLLLFPFYSPYFSFSLSTFFFLYFLLIFLLLLFSHALGASCDIHASPSLLASPTRVHIPPSFCLCALSCYPPFADMFDGQNAPRETRIRRARASLD